MTLHTLPVDVKDELRLLKRDAHHPRALQNLLRRGWNLFRLVYLDSWQRVEASLDATSMAPRFRELEARVRWLQGEVFMHVDLRCKAYDTLWQAHRAHPEDPQVLSSLIRLELAHSRLERAALHLFRARKVRDQMPEFELLEAELEALIAEDAEENLWARVEATEAELASRPEDVSGLVDHAADMFYDVLDLPRAQAAIERALALDPKDPEPWFLGAEIAFEGGQPLLALERLGRMVALAPGDHRGRMLRTNILCSMGAVDPALDSLRSLIGTGGGEPIRVVYQDIFFQSVLADREETHRIWLELLRRGEVHPESARLDQAPGTPSSFFEAQPLVARRIYHQARRLTLRHREGDLRDEIDAGFQALLEEAPEYTFLLDEYARFLLRTAPQASPDVSRARTLAEKAVHLSEAAGEPEARFHATLAAAERVLGA